MRFHTASRSRGGSVLVAALAIDSLGSIGGMLLLERKLPAAALRDRATASVT